MSTRFVNVDRQTPLLLPPDLRDWVRDDDIVHFVLETVDMLPLRQFRVNRRGSGSEQYPPRMMLSLLIYSYATGMFSSREIEAATYSQVSVRFLCANTHPDHDTICRFRRENKALLEETFVQVLVMAAELRILKVGAVAIDGTKIAANASKHSAVSYGRAGELVKTLADEVSALVAKAEGADNTPLLDGLSVPEEIARRETRRDKLQAARRAIEERTRPARQAVQAEYETNIAQRQEKRERGEAVKGREPKAPEVNAPEAGAQYNFTDPESRIMKAGNGKHFVQAYNAQASVATESLLIVGQRVSDAPNDKEQLQPTFESIPKSLGPMHTVIADAGFYSETQIEQVESVGEQARSESVPALPPPSNVDTGTPSPPLVYVAAGRLKHARPLAEFEARPEPAAPDDESPLKERMQHRLRTTRGKAIYKLRKQTVEPVFGIIKEVLGFRRFSMRGLDKTALEWTLVSLAWNLKRLHKLTTLTKPHRVT